MKLADILSSKLTSQNIQNHCYGGFIDKIILDARTLEIHKDELREHLDNLELKYEDGSFRGGGLRIKIRITQDSTAYAKYNFFTKQLSQLILNPSSFSYYSSFKYEVLSIFGPLDVIQLLPLTRIDKTVDITLSYEEVSRGFNVKHKRSVNIYQFMSAQNRSIDIGKSPEVIKLYNRTFKAKLNFPCTRLETCLIRNKIGYKNLKELEEFWVSDKSKEDTTFKNVSFNSIEIHNQNNLPDKKKQNKISVLLDHFPYFLIKSLLNNKGNFLRDYKKIVELLPYKIQPNAVFTTGMRIFFNEDEMETK
ncbi:MAG: hypothetical protein ACJAS4_000370 [Bacteriovoracaceae bacterium]|jgi:hypothetical protein